MIILKFSFCERENLINFVRLRFLKIVFQEDVCVKTYKLKYR